jgi:hypothetical protein
MIFANQEIKNIFIEVMIKDWIKADFRNTSLWEQFQNDFEKWTENDFKTVFNIRLRWMRDILRERDVWVEKNKKVTIAKTLYNTLQKEDLIEWIEKEMLRCMSDEKFIFYVINDLIETKFDRKSKNYFWQRKLRDQRKLKNQRSIFSLSRSFSNSVLRRIISLRSVISSSANQSDKQSNEQSDKQSNEQSNEQSDEQSFKTSSFLENQFDKQSMKQSIEHQSNP